MPTKWSTIREAKGAPPLKRRVIYMDDDAWESLRTRSEAEQVTMSEIIRRALSPARRVQGEVIRVRTAR